MALVEIVRFSSLQEAIVAKSALEAMGFHPVVFDEYRANMIWTEQIAIGGIRLLVPDFEFSEARAFVLRPRRRVKPTAIMKAPNPLETIGYLIACAFFGWPLSGLRRRDLFHRATAVAIIAIVAFTFILFRLRR
jgi:hypothetical protein